MTTYRFQQVTRSRTVYLKCSECQKKRSRGLTVMNTINPYNKNADGSVRTYDEVLACVRQQLDNEEAALAIKGIVCKTCLNAPHK